MKLPSGSPSENAVANAVSLPDLFSPLFHQTPFAILAIQEVAKRRPPTPITGTEPRSGWEKFA